MIIIFINYLFTLLLLNKNNLFLFGLFIKHFMLVKPKKICVLSNGYYCDL